MKPTIEHATADFGTVLLIAGILVVFYFFLTYNYRRSQVKKVFKRFSFTNIEDVKDGQYVKIMGTIWDGGEKVIAPLSERTSVYYYIEVLEKAGSGKNSRWETLFEEEIMGDVVLKSAKYYVVIEANSPLVHVKMDRFYSTGFLKDATPNVEKFLTRHGHDSSGLFGFNRKIEMKEGVLQRGEQCVLAGRAKWISARDLKFKVPVENVLLIYETQDDRVVFSDDPVFIESKARKS